MLHFTLFKNNLGSKCMRKKNWITRNAFICCFHHPYCLPYFGFWLWTLFAPASRGRGEIRTFSSLYSGTRAAHNSSAWAPFSVGSLETNHPCIHWWMRFRESWAHSTYSPTSLGKWDQQKAPNAIRETSAKCSGPLPTPGGQCGMGWLGLPKALSLQHSSWGCVSSPPASQNLQINGTIYSSFHL